MVRKSVHVQNGGGDYVVTWVYSGWNRIEERKTVVSTTTIKNFVWGLDLSQSIEGAGGIGGLIAALDGSGSASLFAYDGNGNVSELLKNSTGSTAAHYEYDAFGNTILATRTAAADNSYRFSTKYADDETGLVYYGYRYYWSEAGRWKQRDPIGERGGLNLYGMVANQPSDFADILGLEAASANPDTIAFYTTGDYAMSSSRFLPAATAYADLKRNPKNLVLAARSVQEAIGLISKIPKSCITKVFFVGHGFGGDPGASIDAWEGAGGGFFLSGKRTGQGIHDFAAEPETQILWATSRHAQSKTFFESLAERLVGDRTSAVYFQSCFSGQPGRFGLTLQKSVANVIGRKGKSVHVEAYINYLQYVTIVEKNGKRTLKAPGTTRAIENANGQLVPIDQPGVAFPAMPPHDAPSADSKVTPEPSP